MPVTDSAPLFLSLIVDDVDGRSGLNRSAFCG